MNARLNSSSGHMWPLFLRVPTSGLGKGNKGEQIVALTITHVFHALLFHLSFSSLLSFSMTVAFVGMYWPKKKNHLRESSLDSQNCSQTHQWEASDFLSKRKGTFRAKPCCCSVCLDPAKTFNHTDWWGAFSWLEASLSTASIPAVHQPCNPFIKALIVLRYTWPWNAGSHTPSSLIMQQNQPASLKWHF